jgi:RHS repeat-associated protein
MKPRFCGSAAAGQRRLQIVCAVLLGVPALARGEVQAPSLGAPQRGSLAGQYGQVAFGAAEVSRGTFSLPSPFLSPTDRGKLLADVFPHYSPDHGLSEWGLGWATNLQITRWRVSGDLDYVTDELTSPWGHLVRGSDGNWYPDGLDNHVKVVAGANDTWVVYAPDGATYTFGGDSRFTTSRGTYAWMLSEVHAVNGEKTSISYERNASGRLFPRFITYGGHEDDYQYQIEIQYVGTQLLFVSYAPGQEYALDRRVSQVVVRAKDRNTRSWVERWHYGLKYLEEELGPAFYLAEVDQQFPSGDAPPPVRYSYQRQKERLPTLTMRPVPKLAPLLAQYGNDEVQSSNTTVLDLDHDGRPDLEDRTDGTLWLQRDAGFVAQSLSPPPSDVYAGCRPAPSTLNSPRSLAQMRAADDSYQVIDTEFGDSVSDTAMYICNREGQPLTKLKLDGNWILRSTVRLVDVNRDVQPDLLWIDAGFYQILPNTSTAAAYSFGAPISGTLSPAFVPTETWAQDFNGDGLVDLVARDEGSIVVWYGKGNFQFVSAGQIFQLYNSSKLPITNLSDYRIGFLDVNKDGLTDVLLSDRSGSLLFINNGFDLNLTPLPGLTDAWTVDMSIPVLTDLAGSGNSEILVTAGDKALSLALDGPEVGLMASADDGRGTVLQFGYARAPAAAGIRQRTAVLAQLDILSTGFDQHHYVYHYDSPHIHSIGKYLDGFEQVTREGPTSTEVASFFVDDDVASVPLGMQRTDRLTPDVLTFEAHQYDAIRVNNVEWMRPKVDRRGYTSKDGKTVLEERTDYSSFEADFCPSQVVVTKQAGTLTTVTTRAAVSGLANALHCLPDTVTNSGSHPDPRWNFQEKKHYVRNEIGLPTAVENLGADGKWIEQTIVYNPDYTVASITKPGRGTTIFDYDPNTHVLAKITGPDGVSTAVTSWSASSDQIEALRTDRGGAAFTQFFRFDGQERLVKTWDDLGHASEASPDQKLAYRYASGNIPGSIVTTSLIDLAGKSWKQTVELATAKGDMFAKAELIPEGWSFGKVAQHIVNNGETKQLLRPTVAAATDPTTLDLGAIYANASPVNDTVTADSGTTVLSTVWFHEDTKQQMVGSLALPSQLVETQVENQQFTIKRTFDAGHRVIAHTDAGGTTWGFRYDALDRLRAVDLPDGTGHRIFFDTHGRVSRIERDSVQTIAYAYDKDTGLLASQTFQAPDGTPIRASGWTYDKIGRKKVQTDVDLLDKATDIHEMFYDGATPANPTAVTTLGFLTGASGDGYTKTMTYRADGKLLERVVAFAGWRTVTTDMVYNDGAMPQSTTTSVAHTGTIVDTATQVDHYDTYGRLSGIDVNGASSVLMHYDGDGLLDSATLPAGATVELHHDRYTRSLVGMTQRTGAWAADDEIHRNDRGRVKTETLSSGKDTVVREYGYSAEAYLRTAKDAQSNYSYSYDSSGMTSDIVENGTDRTIKRSGSVLTVGGVRYELDRLGRTFTKGDLELGYGPNGEVTTASRGATHWQFKYDENGQRLLKLTNGVPVAAYLEEGYLDDSGLIQPFRIAGITVGIVQHGQLVVVPSDIRGTVTGDRNGTARFGTPYGNRAIHPDLAAALDYVNKGYDADLDLIRMGARDYDPVLGAFLTADPLFLADPAQCVKSPAECNLYGYAKDDPVNFADPSGFGTEDATKGTLVHSAIGAVYKLANPTHQVFTNSHPIEKILNAIGGDRLGLLGPDSRGLKLKPDILDMGDRKGRGAGLVEIKPRGSELQAFAEVMLYKTIMAVAGYDVPLQRSSAPGMNGVVTVNGEVVPYYSPLPGVIVYGEVKQEKTQPEGVKIGLPELSPETQKALQRTAVTAGIGATIGAAILTGIKVAGERTLGAALLPLMFMNVNNLRPGGGGA